MVFIRFVDISVDVRVECIKRAKEFLQHHPVLASDLAGRCCIKFIEKIWNESRIPVHLFAYCLLLFKNKTLIRIPPIHNNYANKWMGILQFSQKSYCTVGCRLLGSRDGVVVRALTSHQWDPGFDSRTQRLKWVEFVVG